MTDQQLLNRLVNGATADERDLALAMLNRRERTQTVCRSVRLAKESLQALCLAEAGQSERRECVRRAVERLKLDTKDLEGVQL